jgi:hypothetical protein
VWGERAWGTKGEGEGAAPPGEWVMGAHPREASRAGSRSVGMEVTVGGDSAPAQCATDGVLPMSGAQTGRLYGACGGCARP